MGSQQLLLVLVGVLMIGLMIAFGIVLFVDSSSSANRDAIANDLAQYASKAQAFKRRPKSLGGGGGSFVGYSLTALDVHNANGNYSVSDPQIAHVVIQGIGTEIGYDQVNPVKVAITVTADSMLVAELN